MHTYIHSYIHAYASSMRSTIFCHAVILKMRTPYVQAYIHTYIHTHTLLCSCNPFVYVPKINHPPVCLSTYIHVLPCSRISSHTHFLCFKSHQRNQISQKRRAKEPCHLTISRTQQERQTSPASRSTFDQIAYLRRASGAFPARRPASEG